MDETVAVYCRISRDRAGRAEGVEAQEGWGRDYAAQKWPGAEVLVFKDNDLRSDDDRPGLADLRDAVAAGRVTAVWTVEQSRLHRDEVAWFGLASELLDAGINEVHTNRDGVVSLDEVGGIRAVLSAAEKRKLRRRTRDKHEKLRAEGRPSGGRQFGYVSGRDDEGRPTLVVAEDEAREARWAAEQVLAGWSLSDVARDFRARGVTNVRGGTWSERTVKTMLTKPAIAGLRLVGDREVQATWEPVLDDATWRKVRSMLDGRRQVKGGERRKFLLTSGLARCGWCDCALVAQWRRYSARRHAYYLCPGKDRGGCMRIGIIADPFEEYVVNFALHFVVSPEQVAKRAAQQDEADAEERTLRQAIAHLEVRESNLLDLAEHGEIDRVTFRQRVEPVRQELKRKRRELDRTLDVTAQLVDGCDHYDEVRRRWESLTIGQQKQVLTELLVKVVVKAATPGTKRFDPGRVEISPDWGPAIEAARRADPAVPFTDAVPVDERLVTGTD
jgi:DNA invertase Pin-like site-specific DNA recombinase